MKEIRETILLLCSLYNLGDFIGYKEVEETQGFRTFVFDTSKETGLKYYLKN